MPKHFGNKKNFGKPGKDGFRKKRFDEDHDKSFGKKKFGNSGGFKKKRFGDHKEDGFRKKRDDNKEGHSYRDEERDSGEQSDFKRKRPDDKEGGSKKKRFGGEGEFKRKRFDDKEGGFKKKHFGGESEFKRKRFDDKEGGFKKKQFGGEDDFKRKRFDDKEGGFKKKHFGGEGDFKRKRFDDKEVGFKKKRFGGEGDFKRKRFDDKEGGFKKKPFGEQGGYKKKSFGYNKPFKKKYGKKTGDTSTGFDEKKVDDGTIRLNKYIANAGICSRREADDLIRAGAVKVNGQIITEMGFKVKPGDVVNYGGQTLKQEKLQYVLLNKPKDYITTLDDPEGRKNVMELVQGACRERIYPVGRLDRSTTGILLFTNDGELTKRLTHPRYGIKKIYHVSLDQNLKRSDFDAIAGGIELEDGPIKPDAIDYVGDAKNEIGIEIHSGRNRIVRRIFEKFNYRVVKLDRVYFAGLTKKDLPRGHWRHLDEKELNMLKIVAGKSLS